MKDTIIGIKLRSKWSKLFIVKNVRPYEAIEIEDPRTNKSWYVNRHRLKIYHVKTLKEMSPAQNSRTKMKKALC